MNRIRNGVVVGLWLAGCIAAIALLTEAGSGALALPIDGPNVRQWLRDTDGLTVAFAIIRGVALVVAWYVLATSVLGVVAGLLRFRPLVAVSNALTHPIVRRAINRTAGAGLAGALALPVAVNAQPLNDVPVLHHVAPGETKTSTTSTTVTVQPTPPLAVEPAGSTWTVEPGQNFWTIAEASLTSRLGRAPDNDELTAYWKRVVEANKSRLPNLANPDLIFAGQIVSLPPV